MPKYMIADNGFLHHKGEMYRQGDEVELSEEVANQMPRTVIPMKLADPKKPLDEMTLKELQAVAQAANLEGYSKLSKKELYSALTGIPIPEKAVEADGDEPDSD